MGCKSVWSAPKRPNVRKEVEQKEKKEHLMTTNIQIIV